MGRKSGSHNSHYGHPPLVTPSADQIATGYLVRMEDTRRTVLHRGLAGSGGVIEQTPEAIAWAGPYAFDGHGQLGAVRGARVTWREPIGRRERMGGWDEWIDWRESIGVEPSSAPAVEIDHRIRFEHNPVLHNPVLHVGWLPMGRPRPALL
jgi:hypothetical protein